MNDLNKESTHVGQLSDSLNINSLFDLTFNLSKKFKYKKKILVIKFILNLEYFFCFKILSNALFL